MKSFFSHIVSSPRAAASWRGLNTMFHLFVVLVVASGFLALRWVITLPDRVDAQRTLLVSPSRLTPDSDASLRVVVQNTEDGKPIDDARVAVSLAPSDDPLRARPLFRGRTDEAGTLPVAFHVPSNAPDDAILIVETRSPVGRDRVERPVTIERQYRLLLTTDKPVYQPGQTIHMRAIALSTLDRSPATGASVDFLVEDPRGNKVYRQSVTASHFGVVAADFTLADLVNQGDYKLSVSIDGVTSERTVEVRPYALPKFGLKVSTDRSFYLPGQRVEGTVQADYFFGKPVAQAQVHVVGSVWDVERTVVVDLRGQTDERGSYTFGFDLPRYFAASGFESGQAQFALEISVVDQTNHPEQVSRVLPIAAQPLLIEAVPESGILKLGVENVVYLLTSYPDGRPARAKVRIAGPVGLPAELETNAYGLAEFTFAPTAGTSPVLDVQAQDESGLFAHRRLELGTQAGSDAVLLRTDRAAYLVGETMHLVALTPAPASAMMPSGSIYLDVVKSGQTLSTRSAPVEHGDGKAAARFTVEVTSEMIGEIEIHAYKVGPDGGLVRDTRLVAVDAPRDLKVDVSTDRASYLPGQTALVDLDVQDEQGAAVPAALGVAVVDESVFALQRQAPGFAKLYFLLRQELMEPFVQIDGFALPASQPAENEDDTVRQAQDTAAKASWASVPAATMPQPLNSRQEKVEAAYAAQQEGFALLGRASSLALVALPVALCAGVAIALARSGTAKRSLKRWTGASALLLVIDIVAARALLGAPYTFETEVVFIPLAGTLVLTLLALTVTAWVRRDAGAKTLLLLVLAWAGALFLLLRAVDQGATPPDNLILAALLATPLMPGAFLLFGQSRWVERRRLVGALSTGLGSLTALPLLLMLLPLLSGGLLFGPRMGAMGPQARFRTLGDDEALWNAQPAGVRVEEVALEGEEMEKGAATTVDTQQTHAQAPRLRQWFPETLYWAPDVETDAQGHTALEIPMADSITTWRLTALASSQDGRLGFVTHGLRVFQDFFVDVDLPISLTQGDEISIPVGVFNYLPQAQKVRLEVEPEDWFELLGSGEQTLTIGSNDIEVVYFPIRVRSFGRSGFQVTAWGEQMSDAVRREVDVVPNGKEIRLTESDWLRGDCQVAVDIPQRAVPGASRVEVKIYPGVLAQVVEGLEKILRLPHG